MIYKFLFFALAAIVSLSSDAAGISAKSWLVADGDGNILEEENINMIHQNALPIFSIQHLRTIYTCIDT
jgi:hypothetical protein